MYTDPLCIMGVQPNIGIGSHQPVQDAKADRVFSGLIYVISDDFGQIWKMSKLIHTHTQEEQYSVLFDFIAF